MIQLEAWGALSSVRMNFPSPGHDRRRSRKRLFLSKVVDADDPVLQGPRDERCFRRRRTTGRSVFGAYPSQMSGQVDAVMYRALAAKFFDSVRNHWISTSRSRSVSLGRDALVSADIAPAILGERYG